MTNQSVREEIASAASAVDGVSCTPYFRQISRPGDSCVRFGGWTRSTNGFGGMNTWEVIVCLTQDLKSADSWMDQKMSDLIEQVGEALIVQTVQPQQLQVDTGLIPVLVISGTRAAE